MTLSEGRQIAALVMRLYLTPLPGACTIGPWYWRIMRWYEWASPFVLRVSDEVVASAALASWLRCHAAAGINLKDCVAT
jgi:hypothetical protein